MSINIQHPMGLSPPRDWEDGRGGLHTSAAEYQAWLQSTKPADKSKGRSKYNAKRGHRDDLGHHCESKLEANTERLIRFLGYKQWTGDGDPPATGRYYRYEGRKIVLTVHRGKPDEHGICYVPDYWIWTDGRCEVWECKGKMRGQDKLKIRLMGIEHPEWPLTVITEPELEMRKAEALFAARRHGDKAPDVPNWEYPERKEGAR